MTARLEMIELDAIDTHALIRDRSALDEDAMAELVASVARQGVRMPVEVYALDRAGQPAYGLISGFRRVEALRRLHRQWGLPDFLRVPAFVREPDSIAEAMIGMVEENEVRAPVSAYERGRIALLAVEAGFFPTIEEAVDRLYATASRQKRSKLRAIARLSEELDGLLVGVERLSELQLLRLAQASGTGFGDVIRTALAESRMTEPEGQWKLLLPILAEAEQAGREPGRPARGGRPRRVIRPRKGLTVRRELAREGWILRFTGPEATGELMELVMDQIERWVMPER